MNNGLESLLITPRLLAGSQSPLTTPADRPGPACGGLWGYYEPCLLVVLLPGLRVPAMPATSLVETGSMPSWESPDELGPFDGIG